MPPAPVKSASAKKKANKYTPATGRDFEIEVRVTDEYKTSRVRDNLSYMIMVTALLALALSAGRGFYSGTFEAVKDVWTVAGPLIGAIVGYYFHRGRKDSE